MIHGIPWSKPEEDLIIFRSISDTPVKLQKDLKALGFNRTLGAVERKIKRVTKQNGIPGTYMSINDPEIIKPKIGKTKWITGSLNLNKTTPTKFIMMNDVHVPHNIDLTNVFEFIKDFKPDYILLVGDIVNNDPFDHWAKAKPGQFKGMPSPKPYYEQCNREFYRPLRKVAGNNCKLVHWIGNHEYWSNRAIDEMPEGEGYWEVENNIEGIDLWVPSKQIANLGKLHFIHGDVIAGGRNHSAKMLNYYRRNVLYGHYHNYEVSSFTSPIDIEDRHTAKCVGTLEKFNPAFMTNRPHQWINMFSYGIVLPNGNFFDKQAVITDNQFYAEAKLYA